jgi:hypothetical protein
MDASCTCALVSRAQHLVLTDSISSSPRTHQAAAMLKWRTTPNGPPAIDRDNRENNQRLQ